MTGYGIISNSGGGGGGSTVNSFATNGNDTTTVVVAALVGKTLLSLTSGGVNRNFDPAVLPVDATFTSGTGTIVFASATHSEDVISGTYK